jgi:hypothetical protein
MMSAKNDRRRRRKAKRLARSRRQYARTPEATLIPFDAIRTLFARLRLTAQPLYAAAICPREFKSWPRTCTGVEPNISPC